METQNNETRERRTVKSRLVNLVRKIRIRYHDSKADYFRYSWNKYDLASYTSGISPSEKIRLQGQAIRCIEKAKYHEKKADKYKVK